MKNATVVLFAGVLAGTVSAEILIRDVMEPTHWTLQNAPKVSFATSEPDEALTPTRGTDFLFFELGNGDGSFINASAVYDLGTVLAAGTYTVTVDVGDGTNSVFTGTADNRLSIGLFDDATVASGSNIRDAIKSFNSGDGISVASTIPEPSDGYRRWIYIIEVATNSSLIGSTLDFGIGWNSGADGSDRAAAIDNLILEYTPAAVIKTGSGQVVTEAGLNFKSAGKQVEAFRDDIGYSAGMEIGITGTMKWSGYANGHQNEKVGFAVCASDASAATSFQLTGQFSSDAYALFAATSVDYPGTSEKILLKSDSIYEDQAVIDPVSSTDNEVSYSLNITFPTNFNTGASGDDFIYTIEYGIDYDQDGTNDLYRVDTMNIYEYDRIRFGFVVNKGATPAETAATNDYSYVVYDSHVEITQPGPLPSPTSGTNVLVTPISSGWSPIAERVTGFPASDGYAANDQVFISGSMELLGSPENDVDDKVGFVFGGMRSEPFPTSGKSAETNNSLYFVTTAAYPGADEVYTIAHGGVRENGVTLTNAGDNADTEIDYWISVRFPTNFNAGADGDGFIYTYEFGIDYEQDGTDDLVRSGTFEGFEFDNLNFGMVSTHGASAEPGSITNAYTFNVTHLPAQSMEAWLVSYGLAGADLDGEADPDLDGRNNLYEYGFGGNPTNANDVGTAPKFAEADGGGMTFIHLWRIDESVSYQIEWTSSLVNPAWTYTGYAAIGTNVLDAAYAEVTNSLPADLDSMFIKITLEQL